MKINNENGQEKAAISNRNEMWRVLARMKNGKHQ